MDTGLLKTFAQGARRQLREQVTARLEAVLQIDTGELREREQAIQKLREQISQSSKGAVIERVAYTWFNRFCALRYMDANHYTRVGVVSPVAGFTQPEILQEAKQGVIDEFFKVDRRRVLDLLSGQLPAKNPQQEVYRLLLVGACNAYHELMPFLFEPIADYTELLLPEDLLSENSILHAMRQALSEAVCQDVEAIGWLYQFYISERKDEVFANLKKNIKIEARDIPAATQLFTPHWIVRYLVENSLGRLWMLNHPDSKLVEQMDYYIRPEHKETDYLAISSPEKIKICDPACGSGHMLTYAFDLLYAIYAEEGYDPLQIPRLILEKNLYGIEIDERAGALAAFALTMRALQRDRRFLNRKVAPNICVLRNVKFNDSELEGYMQVVGCDLFTEPLLKTLRQFEQADNFGSLIQPQLKDVGFIKQRIKEKGVFDNLLLYHTNRKVQQVLEMAEYLSPRYHVVVANPPYMGSGGMNTELKGIAQEQFPDSKSDLGVMFIERNISIALKNGYVGMITMQSWMFLTSYEKLREKLLHKESIISMAHLGPRAFDTIGGEIVSTTSFVIQHFPGKYRTGTFIRLIKGSDEKEKSELLLKNIPVRGSELPKQCFEISSADFNKIPGSPIAYWVSKRFTEIIQHASNLGELTIIREGLTTGNNEYFIRYWYEVETNKIGFGISTQVEAQESGYRWFPYIKGGGFRRWYGNNDYVVNWFDRGREIHEYAGVPLDYVAAPVRAKQYYFNAGITWTRISSTVTAFRVFPPGFIFDSTGPSIFPKNMDPYLLTSILNGKPTRIFLEFVAPTLDFRIGPVSKIPIVEKVLQITSIARAGKVCVNIAKFDWDSYEISWEFDISPLLSHKHNNDKLNEAYARLYSHWCDKTNEMQNLEQENNRIFIVAYGLQDDLKPEVPLEEITLTCNPYYRYRGNKSNKELEILLFADTMKEFISYVVGCMFGRYSLDKPGLILANQGETARDYSKQVPDPSFQPDEDNVLPILEEGWFTDDIAERFKKFLRVTFGEKHFNENLAFLENAIGKDIRSYFLKDFYNEHIKMYKKRPIYWLFSSPKGSFNALIYMHRYRPDTVSVVLNNYLREYRRKLSVHKAHLEQVSVRAGAGQSEKTKALKEINELNKVLTELTEYEDEILYPLATQKIEIDLDGGVKVNYNKFGKALKRVSGLSEELHKS